MSVRRERCGDCGSPVVREVPDGDSRTERLLREVPLYCDDCDRREAERQRAEDERLEVERKRERRWKTIRDSGLPAKHHDACVAGLDHPASVLEAVAGWVSDGGGLLLTGEVGVGKTTLAGAAAWERLQHGRVTWTSAPLLLARLGSGHGNDQRDLAVDLLLSSHVPLVLDDIDKARPTAYGAEQVFLAVDERVEHEAPLLVTSNMAPSQLAERWPEPYGHPIASRLVGYCRVVRVGGGDRRLSRERIGSGR